MANSEPTLQQNWEPEPRALPAPAARVRVIGLPRFTEFDVALRRIREMLLIIILLAIVAGIIFVVVAGASLLQGVGDAVVVSTPTPTG